MKVRVGAVAGIDRSLPAGELGASFEVAGDGLRVLMVISRPAGAADAGFRMIARPLLERLEAVRGQVDLVVLRPPTLDALAGTLAEAEAAGEPFRVVHFDGHGVLAGRRAAGAGAPGCSRMRRPIAAGSLARNGNWHRRRESASTSAARKGCWPQSASTTTSKHPSNPRGG